MTNLARFITWTLLYAFAVAVMACAFGVAIGFGIPAQWAAAPFFIILGNQWTKRMFDALGLN